MQFLWFVLIGLAAGWLAGQIMKTGSQNWIGDLIVGVIGAVLGGALLEMIGFHATGLLGSLISATLGSVVFIAILRAIRNRSI